jgi:hypothetical protein
MSLIIGRPTQTEVCAARLNASRRFGLAPAVAGA